MREVKKKHEGNGNNTETNGNERNKKIKEEYLKVTQMKEEKEEIVNGLLR